MTLYRPGNGKQTQGEIKMMRYIEDLVRNKHFQRSLKRLRNSHKDISTPSGNYYDWPLKEQQKHDYINKELVEIINTYETLRKRCKKLFKDKYWRAKETIAEVYGLDNDEINLAETLFLKKAPDVVDSAIMFAEPDMCKIVDLHDDELSPANKGEEIIYLSPSRRLRIIAYPIAISIHPKASKRDILDFIEKRWEWLNINYLKSYADKTLKNRKRKHKQELLDYIWDNKFVN